MWPFRTVTFIMWYFDILWYKAIIVVSIIMFTGKKEYNNSHMYLLYSACDCSKQSHEPFCTCDCSEQSRVPLATMTFKIINNSSSEKDDRSLSLRVTIILGNINFRMEWIDVQQLHYITTRDFMLNC